MGLADHNLYMCTHSCTKKDSIRGPVHCYQEDIASIKERLEYGFITV